MGSQAEKIDELDSEVQASVVYVARQPGGVSAAVPLSALRDFHTRTQSGGRGEATYFPHLYARVPERRVRLLNGDHATQPPTCWVPRSVYYWVTFWVNREACDYHANSGAYNSTGGHRRPS